MNAKYLESSIKQFLYYKQIGELTINSIPEDQLFTVDYAKKKSVNNNSLAVIVKHISGNMLSRWTNFMTEDGEKSWRNREDEFSPTINNKKELLDLWEQGWTCLFDALKPLTNADLDKIVYIRNMGHTVVEAINRQMMHYAYHIGQIVLIGKQIQGDSWKSLSIPLGESKKYNQEKFSKPKSEKNFIDDELNP